MHGADCGIDNSLVCGKMKVCIKRKIRYNGARIPECVKVLRLRVLGVEILGLRKRKH